MTIRDLASLDHLTVSRDELIDVCKHGGPVSKKYPNLAADITRKAMALKGSVARLQPAIDEAGPPPVPKERPPLCLRQNDPVIQAILMARPRRSARQPRTGDKKPEPKEKAKRTPPKKG